MSSAERAQLTHPSRTLIKICGITRLEDGLAALEAGADWLGFIRAERSPRFRPLDELIELVTRLRARAPAPFQAVGVYVDASPETIEDEARRVGLDRIQLHGRETPELARSLSRPVVKVIHIRDAESVKKAEAYEGMDLLTDVFTPDSYGGTGRGYDYEWLRDLILRRRVIVAGGLTIENVAEVMRSLAPWGVDVSSAVETAPGIKAPARIRAFIENARCK